MPAKTKKGPKPKTATKTAKTKPAASATASASGTPLQPGIVIVNQPGASIPGSATPTPPAPVVGSAPAPATTSSAPAPTTVATAPAPAGAPAPAPAPATATATVATPSQQGWFLGNIWRIIIVVAVALAVIGILSLRSCMSSSATAKQSMVPESELVKNVEKYEKINKKLVEDQQKITEERNRDLVKAQAAADEANRIARQREEEIARVRKLAEDQMLAADKAKADAEAKSKAEAKEAADRAVAELIKEQEEDRAKARTELLAKIHSASPDVRIKGPVDFEGSDDIKERGVSWDSQGGFRFPLTVNNQGLPTPILGSSEPFFLAPRNVKWERRPYRIEHPGSQSHGMVVEGAWCVSEDQFPKTVTRTTTKAVKK